MKRKKKRKNRRSQRQARSRCVRCGGKTYKKGTYCSKCLKSSYLRKYLSAKRTRRERYIICKLCGSSRRVMPFVGLCEACYKNQRPLREVVRRKNG